MLEAAWLTVSGTAVAVLLNRLLSPPYTALSECVPPDKPIIVYVAVAVVVPVSPAVPSDILPSSKVTVPVGVIPLPPATVAVIVTLPFVLKLIGLGDADTVVLEVPRTVCVREACVLRL